MALDERKPWFLVLAADERTAEAILARRIRDEVFPLIRHRLPRGTDCDDVIAEAFLRARAALARLVDKSRIRQFLATIVLRAARGLRSRTAAKDSQGGRRKRSRQRPRQPSSSSRR